MLYPHNRETYKDALTMLSRTHKCAIIQFTGTGKTFITMELLNSIFKDMRVLYVVPNVSIEHSIKLYDEWNYDNVVFTTYSNLKNCTDMFDVLILDELHRAGASTWEIAVREMMTKVKYALGLTATPERYLDGGRDMALELFGDNIVYGVDLEKALELGVLPKFNYTAILSYRTTELVKLVDKISAPDIRLKLLSLDLSHYSVKERIRKYIEPYHRKCIVFCSDIKQLKNIDGDIRSWFEEPVRIFSVHSEKSNKDNKRTIEEFNKCEDLCVIKSVDMLNAGIHIKGVTLAIMCRSTESGNVFIQQMGRILSASDKTRVPQIIDLVRNFKNIKVLESCGKSLVKVQKPYSTLLARESMIAYDDMVLEVEDVLNSIRKLNTWTDAEDNILKQYYPTDGREVAKLLPRRSANACVARAKKLGLRKDTNSSWEYWEDQILLARYLCFGKGVLNDLPDRTWESCTKRALKLGIIYPWTSQEDLIMMYHYENYGSNIQKMLPNHSAKEIEIRAKKLGLFAENR